MRARLLTRENLAISAVLLALALVPVIAGLMNEPFYLRLFSRFMIFAIAAVSLDIILGYGGMVSLGHSAFVGIGAYTVGILAFHADADAPALPFGIPGTVNAFAAWPLAIAATALAATLIGAISLVTRGVPFIMITLAFCQMLYFMLISAQRYGGDDGLQIASRSQIPGLDLNNRAVFYYLVLAVLIAAIIFGRRLIASRFGMVLQGARQNERRLNALGVPTFRYRLAAFAIAGAIAGVAGILLANSNKFVSPADMSWIRSGELVVMVVLGGMGTIYGPVAGAIVFLLLEQIIGNYTTHWPLVFGPLLILAVLVNKRGIWGLVAPKTPTGDAEAPHG